MIEINNENNKFLETEFEKRRIYKNTKSFCYSYDCPIFQNSLAEIKQLNNQKDKLENNYKALKKYLIDYRYDKIDGNYSAVMSLITDILNFVEKIDNANRDEERWAVLKTEVERLKKESRYANDAYRFLAYSYILSFMNRLEGEKKI